MHALSTDELLNYCAGETQAWHDWFKKNPAALDINTDIAGGKSVRNVVQHIVGVELRYSERLLGLPVTDMSVLSSKTVDDLFSTATRSEQNMRSFLGKANGSDWETVLTFPTVAAGNKSASKRKIFVHALLHGVRHWAQLATLLRGNGNKQDWPHDFLFSTVFE